MKTTDDPYADIRHTLVNAPCANWTNETVSDLLNRIDAHKSQLDAARELLRGLSDWWDSDDAEAGESPKGHVFAARKWLKENDDG